MTSRRIFALCDILLLIAVALIAGTAWAAVPAGALSALSFFEGMMVSERIWRKKGGAA